MLEELPELKKYLDVHYTNLPSDRIEEKYAKLLPPAVMINGIVFSEGHVPIIKKLSRDLLDLVKL